MYLRVLGASRDRTADLMSFRGVSLKAIRPNQETSDSSLTRSFCESQDSPMERFFQLSNEIRQEIADLHVAYDNLLKKHKECLRPTFSDTSDSVTEINSLSATINTRLETISQRISYLVLPVGAFPDRSKIITNLRTGLTDAYRDFSTKFRLEQQAFSATFGKKGLGKRKKPRAEDDIDLMSLNFGTPGNEQRVAQMQQQRNEEEIEQIARRAEEIRNIFADLASLISEQGTIIDRIDFCISETLNNAVEAQMEVEQAARYQQKSRMWICVVVLVVLIALLLVMAWLK
jgi:syntaxin 16